MSGSIVAGVMAPHPPHLVYAENPPQNEPRAECGWENLRWAYERLRKSLADRPYDVLVVHTPHWKTVVGHHLLGVPRFESLSVDPVFPNLFRYNYALDVDVPLAEAIAEEGAAAGLSTTMMRNPEFRVDYGTIVACHMVNPAWDKPIVAISSNRAYWYFSDEVGDAEMVALGEATRRAVERTGRRAVLLASNSLSHRHFTVEPPIPEDMSHEHVQHHGQYLWDMHVLDLMRTGRTRQLLAEMPDFVEHAQSECREGALTWLLGAMGFPDWPATVHGYGTVIGTGNAVVEWDMRRAPSADPQAGLDRPAAHLERARSSSRAAARDPERSEAARSGLPLRPAVPDPAKGARAPSPRANEARAQRGAAERSQEGSVLSAWIVPGRPHPLLAPEKSPAWGSLRRSFERAREEIQASGADLLLLYSTQWPSVIGHQVQADPAPTWVHVDEEWHALGSIPYTLRIDAEFAQDYVAAAQARGLHARGVAYHGFPVDTGSVVALTLLDPERRIPACIVSCNMYADRAETLVLGKAARDAIARTGKKAVAIAVTALSNRLFTTAIDPAQDRISSEKDDEWNRKLLEFLAEGRLEDVSQLARTFTREANADNKLKAIWWLGAVAGAHNRYVGTVYDYQPIHGTGAAIVGLVPSEGSGGDLEFDEDDVEFYRGDRNVLTGSRPQPEPQPEPPPAGAGTAPPTVDVPTAPRPVGAYPHARREGEWLFLSGMGPRDPETNEIPGGPVRDAAGAPLPYDAAAQTRATIANVRRVLEASGARLEDVVDVQAFLIDMDRDFAAYNAVYGEHFGAIRPTRTTVEVRALPTPIAVELKVVARIRS